MATDGLQNTKLRSAFIAFKHGLEIVVNIMIGVSVFVVLPDELPYKKSLNMTHTDY